MTLGWFARGFVMAAAVAAAVCTFSPAVRLQGRRGEIVTCDTAYYSSLDQSQLAVQRSCVQDFQVQGYRRVQ